jgi:hypothetical protein
MKATECDAHWAIDRLQVLASRDSMLQRALLQGPMPLAQLSLAQLRKFAEHGATRPVRNIAASRWQQLSKS